MTGNAELIEAGTVYSLSLDSYSTLMAHGVLATLPDGRCRLATEGELRDDPGSAGVNHNSPGAVLACLRAALRAQPAGGKVRELTWVGQDYCQTRGALFQYEVKHDGNEPEEWSLWRNDKLLGFHFSERAACDAAQADYERRIFAALEPAALSKQEAVAWTGSGSLSALANGNYGHIWPSKADAHPIPLYASPVPAEPSAEGWREISEGDEPQHGLRVLLGWRDWRDGTWCTEVSAYSTGQRYDNGCSSVSTHGSATHWLPLPPAPHGEGA